MPTNRTNSLIMLLLLFTPNIKKNSVNNKPVNLSPKKCLFAYKDMFYNEKLHLVSKNRKIRVKVTFVAIDDRYIVAVCILKLSGVFQLN